MLRDSIQHTPILSFVRSLLMIEVLLDDLSEALTKFGLRELGDLDRAESMLGFFRIGLLRTAV